MTDLAREFGYYLDICYNKENKRIESSVGPSYTEEKEIINIRAYIDGPHIVISFYDENWENEDEVIRFLYENKETNWKSLIEVADKFTESICEELQINEKHINKLGEQQ